MPRSMLGSGWTASGGIKQSGMERFTSSDAIIEDLERRPDKKLHDHQLRSALNWHCRPFQQARLLRPG